MTKICLVASSGGHFEQLKRLSKLESDFECFYVTEKTKYKADRIKYTIPQVNRKELLFPVKILWVAVVSLYILVKESPDYIISTGALATIPLMYFGHKRGVKVVYIESFAKINDPTLTGKFVYKHKIASKFYVQWESMLEFYPNAIYLGGIY